MFLVGACTGTQPSSRACRKAAAARIGNGKNDGSGDARIAMPAGRRRAAAQRYLALIGASPGRAAAWSLMAT